MTDMPDEPPEYIHPWWSAGVKRLTGRYYHPALDIATLLTAFFGLLGGYGLYAGLEGATSLLAAAGIVVIVFGAIAYHDERRWRA